MPQYNVYRVGSTWYFNSPSVPISEPFDTRDAAEVGAQKAVIDARKVERKAKEEMKKEEKKSETEES